MMKADGAPHRDKMGIPYGLRDLDALTLGLHGAQLTVVAALPGRGKTTLGLQVAAHVAASGFEVMFFSLEQSRDELLKKRMSAQARVDGHRLRKGELSTAEWARLVTAADTLGPLTIRIDDTPGLDIGQIRTRAMSHRDRTLAAHKRPLGLIVIDYIQKLAPLPELTRSKKHEQIAASSDQAKKLSIEMKVPVLVLAQQRPAEIDKFTKVRPRPAGIADCNQVERDADNLYYLHREPLRTGGKISGEDPRMVTLIVDKQRVGETGEVPLTFEREFSSFVTREPDEAPTTPDHEPLLPATDWRASRAGPDE
jgi:replicative DNA helicase